MLSQIYCQSKYCFCSREGNLDRSESDTGTRGGTCGFKRKAKQRSTVSFVPPPFWVFLSDTKENPRPPSRGISISIVTENKNKATAALRRRNPKETTATAHGLRAFRPARLQVAQVMHADALVGRAGRERGGGDCVSHIVRKMAARSAVNEKISKWQTGMRA